MEVLDRSPCRLAPIKLLHIVPMQSRSRYVLITVLKQSGPALCITAPGTSYFDALSSLAIRIAGTLPVPQSPVTQHHSCPALSVMSPTGWPC